MRQMPSADMAGLLSFLAVLPLILPGIDVRRRAPADRRSWSGLVFAWASRIGGVATAPAHAC